MYQKMIRRACIPYQILIQAFVIKGFKTEMTRAAFEGEALKGFPSRSAEGHAPEAPTAGQRWCSAGLTFPAGNRLEALKGDRAGQHSIRVNDQFRICFIWKRKRAIGG